MTCNRRTILISPNNSIFILETLKPVNSLGISQAVSVLTQKDFITVGKIKTGPIIQADTIIVTLDNNETITVTPDTEFMLRDGSYIKAAELEIGSSLMPLYMSNLIYQENTDYYKKSYNQAKKRHLKYLVAEYQLQRRVTGKDKITYKDSIFNIIVGIKKDTYKKNTPFIKEMRKAKKLIRDQNNHRIQSLSTKFGDYVLPLIGIDTYNVAVNGVFIKVDSNGT